MSDTLPTTWRAEPHTLAKHAILERYLKAWFPILTQQASSMGRRYGAVPKREILYVDGFAGPGEYTNHKDGSPVLAIKSVLNHAIQFPIPVRMLFIEQRKDRFENLKRVLAPHLACASHSSNIRKVEMLQGDCDALLKALLDDCECNGIAFGPALAFLDQFGYGDVSMDLISRILKFPQCEIFSYLDYKDMNRWITDQNKAIAFTRAYGGQEWRDAMNLPEAKRRTRLLELYKAALQKRGNATYVTSFSMFDKDGQPLYWLFFCTNNIRGLEEMKKAMWAVDKTGEFRFSDEDSPSQLRLFSDLYGQAWLAGELVTRLAGRTMSAETIKEFVLTDTPCYLFKKALGSLEAASRAKVVKAPYGRKERTYPDQQLAEIVIKFEASLLDN